MVVELNYKIKTHHLETICKMFIKLNYLLFVEILPEMFSLYKVSETDFSE